MSNEIDQYIDSLVESENMRRAAKYAAWLKELFTKGTNAIKNDKNAFYEKLINPMQDIITPQSVIDNRGLECAGTYYVSGYTREDGTEVSGYMRTCGAAHNNADEKWVRPLSGRITSEFGPRKAPVPGASTFHNGWDIGVPTGTPIRAIADGKVFYAGNNDPKGYGNYIILNHGNIGGVIVKSEYGHISQWIVKPGQQVKKGDIIGYSGNAGVSNGPHLHITIKENGKAVNPEKYISRK